MEKQRARMLLKPYNPALTSHGMRVLLTTVAWVGVGQFAVIVERIEEMAEFRIDTTIMVGR